MIPAIAALAVALLAAAVKLIQANGDPVKEEDALFEAEEALKAERDRRKFG